MSSERVIRIVMVAGEVSGDFLGAGLIAALKKKLKKVEFWGIGGPQMTKEGLRSLVPMERLSVMGLTDVLRRYPELYGIHKKLLQECVANPPDVFIGVDYQHFNLSVAEKLKPTGIKTIQYVSPQVWAWRPKRVLRIKKAVDLMLTLFPFEELFYNKHQVPVAFVGHPLADVIPLKNDIQTKKSALGYKADDTVVAVLPGSRLGELRHIGGLCWQVMYKMSFCRPKLRFVVPVPNEQIKEAFERQRGQEMQHIEVQVLVGQAREALAAADVALVKSGTGTLEAMLLKCPMVVAYKYGIINHIIFSPQIKSPFYSQPNLLANQALVLEFLQYDACPEKIAEALLALLDNPARREYLQQRFEAIHADLRQNTNDKASEAVLELLSKFTEPAVL
ncbi:MAG: lipid-A-disaccharide synthase [Legionellaceae bacterium]|nr:lipid-A-disaccharide synthase [Legionellaceae bacterium]